MTAKPKVSKAELDARWASVLRLLKSIPKKYYKQLSGRDDRTLIDQAARWNIPLEGPTVDLAAVVRAFHDHLAKWGVRLKAIESSEEMMSGSGSPALERYREERAKMAKIERLRLQGVLVHHSMLQEHFNIVAHLLRRFADQLEIEFGEPAVIRYNDFVNEIAAAIDKQLADWPNVFPDEELSLRVPPDPTADPEQLQANKPPKPAAKRSRSRRKPKPVTGSKPPV